jgi:hypothetical protein
VGAGHVGVHEHGGVEAAERRAAQGLGEHCRRERTHAETAVLLGYPQGQHAELAHLLQDLARHHARLLPRFTVGGDLPAHELDRLVVDLLEVVVDVGVAVRHRLSP